MVHYHPYLSLLMVFNRLHLCVDPQKVGRGIWFLAVLKLVPLPIAKFLVYTGLARRLSTFFQMADRSLTEVVNGLTENKDLRAVFTYIFGTYGTMQPRFCSRQGFTSSRSAHTALHLLL